MPSVSLVRTVNVLAHVIVRTFLPDCYCNKDMLFCLYYIRYFIIIIMYTITTLTFILSSIQRICLKLAVSIISVNNPSYSYLQHGGNDRFKHYIRLSLRLSFSNYAPQYLSENQSSIKKARKIAHVFCQFQTLSKSLCSLMLLLSPVVWNEGKRVICKVDSWEGVSPLQCQTVWI